MLFAFNTSGVKRTLAVDGSDGSQLRDRGFPFIIVHKLMAPKRMSYNVIEYHPP